MWHWLRCREAAEDPPRPRRDTGGKLGDHRGLAPHFAQQLARVARLLAQQKTDHDNL